jgi:diguanylate cyclase (GGDEF)-like protein
MKDPRVVEIEFLSGLERSPPGSVAQWEWEKTLSVSRQFFLDMVYGLFLDRCLEGVSSILPPYPTNPYAGTFDKWGDFQRGQAVTNLLQYTAFAAYINHKGRVRLWQLRDDVQKARTKEKFGILWSREHWDSEVLIALAMKDQSKPSAVLFMDLNNFKPVNDTYGHDVGDDVMKTYFRTVLTLVGTAGDVYAWGGDEVVVFLRETDQPMAEKMAEVIKAAVAKECSAQPVLAKNNHLIAVACGKYVFSEPKSPAEIAKAADDLMYEDKKKMKAGG